MNNKFSLKRFGQFACAEFKANNKQFIMSILTIIIIMIVGYIFYYTINDNIRSLVGPIVFSGGVAMFGSFLFASTAFKKYFNRNKNVETIMIPAARSEKFTYQYLLNVIAMPILLSIAVLVCYVLASVLLGLNMNFESPEIFIASALGQICNLSIFFLGSIIFRRNAFILTCLSIGGLIVSITIIAVATQDWIVWDYIKNLLEPFFEYLSKNCSMDQIRTIILNLSNAGSLIVTAIVTFIAWKKFKTIQTSK